MNLNCKMKFEKYLKENNIEVIEVSKITNFEEMLDGRVKYFTSKYTWWNFSTER